MDIFTGAIVFLFPVALLLFLWINLVPSFPVPIRGQHVLITGGSSGIGLELSKLVAKEGARISILARDPQRLQKAKEAILSFAGNQADVRVFSADVSDTVSIKNAVSEAGPVDVLICSHGISIPSTLEDAEEESFDRMLDTNARGTRNIIRAVLPAMKTNRQKSPGCIAIFCSQAGQVGVYGFPEYSYTKYGLRGFAEGLQQEVFTYKIQVSLIYPPDTETPGFAEENKIKPEVTKLISDSSSCMKAPDVAKKALDGIRNGKFNVYCNFDGFMLGVLTTGMSPQSSLKDAVLEVTLMGLMRIVGISVTKGWYNTISKWRKGQKKLM